LIITRDDKSLQMNDAGWGELLRRKPHQPLHTRVVTMSWRIADALSALRLILIPLISCAAVVHQGRLVAFGLLVAGATDFLDGYLARRLHQESARGARLDSIADTLLLIAAAVWIQMLHPEIFRENPALVAITLAFYLASLPAGRVNSLSSKVAGGLLYSFAVLTFAAGTYSSPLLWLAAAALTVSSAETFILLVRRRRQDIANIHITGKAR
jgi:phosphatidylglycerophosphate synthase